MKNLLSIIFKKKPRYKIVRVPHLGFLPMCRCREWGVWRGIAKDGSMSNSLDRMISYPYLTEWHRTEESAGKLINEHSSNLGLTTVWEG